MRLIKESHLKEIVRHTRRLGLQRFLKSMGYERAAELPFIAEKLAPYFRKKLKLLDIGSGDSVFPSYLVAKTNWEITCVDGFRTVQIQRRYARRVLTDENSLNLLIVREENFLNADFTLGHYDIILSISVIEHLERNDDSNAMKKLSTLLKPGGIAIITVPVNEGHFKEFYVHQSVYGEVYRIKPLFYQRHYDTKSLQERLIQPSGLDEEERVYFGEYDEQFSEKYMAAPFKRNPWKIFYKWNAANFAKRYITYRDYPVSRDGMPMFTSSGVIIILRKA